MLCRIRVENQLERRFEAPCARSRRRAHGLRGDRPPVLHRHPRRVPHIDARVLRLCARILSRRGLPLLSGTLSTVIYSSILIIYYYQYYFYYSQLLHLIVK